MMEKDVIKNPHEYCFGMQMEEEYPDNFSMSIEALYKILDEDDADPRSLDFSGIPKVSHLEKMECQSHHDALHPQPEVYPTEMVANFLNESRCNKSLFGHHFQHNGTCDHFSSTCYEEPVNEEIHDMSRHVESNDSHGESFGSLVIDDANFRNLQNNDSNYYSLGSADEIGLTYPHYSITADTDLDAPGYNHASEGVETTLHNSFRRFIDNLDYISSPSVCHMGESLSHSKLLDHEGCCAMNINATPYSTTQNGSIQRSVVTSGSENLALTHHFNVSPKINGAEEFSESRDANNSFLMDVTENILINAEDASKPSLLVQMRDLPHDEVVLLCGDNREGAQLNLGNDSVKYEVEGQSPHSSVLDESVVDLSVFEPCGLCIQQCKCEDIGIMSESSTDSSPMLYHHKPVLHNLNCSSTKSELTVSDCKVGLQRKLHDSSLKNKKQPQISTNGQEHRTFKNSKIICQSNPSRLNSTLDDVLIIEEISDPVPPIPPPAHFNSQLLSHPCSFSDYRAGQGTLRSWPDDERLTFRLALQDLSQPKAEANPPDGVLAVPLLRHQRIALSWMVQKETAGLNCSGGILADDQGLGKTISTIALILTERSPSSSCSLISEDCEFEPLNLDDEEDDGKVYFEGDKKNHHSDSLLSMPVRSEKVDDGKVYFEGDKKNHHSDSLLSMPVRSEKVDCSLLPARSEKVDCSLLPLRPEKVLVPVKGRPAAGTLVVCPTSVLRQWADELQSKITNKAKFSFLIYHGSNRTKDPYELAKFDVVVTTYAIVSMEVPKQSLVDKDEMERGKHDGCSILAGNLTCKRRKESSSVSLKNPKRKIASDSSVFNFTPRPLAKVGWFRVILDEAQSIKNHRTQVARACWGLRAKRRWCLSGTPIQNAVDDLYSYFRFLRYDPYAVYKSFCSTIKLPISRNPTNGYKKLQAVLKTVMLRRTKGTLIDGKPIISLPPKTVNLKRVDFSDEEFMFYLALEAECRKQFKVYAAAGTVKQNYVNILLMLLRLRQACDHPLLVKCHDSSSVWKSSLEKAKKLPKDKLMDLLSCLEACLAICTICNDPPEDAVVSICGHVFCNQCICEHITGDDNICPSANCKNELSVGCIFSVDTLRRCLAEQPGIVFCSDNSISDVDHGAKISQQSLFSSSSKIRAALEILHSLPLSKISFSPYEALKPFNGSSVLLKNTISAVSSECSSDTAMDQKPILDSNVKHREKAIIFSQWTRMLDLLETSLKDSGILYRRLDGTMSVISREKAIKDFNRLPEITVIIMSLKAASLGLNMVAACHVVLLDLWWNPTTEDQAIDRAHRIGQTRPVTVFRLTVKETVEDRILALQEKKRMMVASAFGEDESGTRQSRLTVEDLKYLFLG